MDDLDALKRRAKAQGWQVERTGGGHLRWQSPAGGGAVFSGSTPSDRQALHKLRGRLRKKGLTVFDSPAPGSGPLPEAPRNAPETAEEAPAAPEKICPICRSEDLAAGDPRGGLRPLSAFAPDRRTAGGLSRRCRHHKGWRGANAAPQRTPAPAPDQGMSGTEDLPSVSDDGQQVLLGSLAVLERRVHALETAQRGTAEEPPRDAVTPDVTETLREIAARLEVLEQYDACVPALNKADLRNPTDIKRLLKNLNREHARLNAQVGDVAEQARAARSSAQEALERAGEARASDETLLAALYLRIETVLDSTINAHLTAFHKTPPERTLPPMPTLPDNTADVVHTDDVPDGLHTAALALLCSYRTALRNLDRIAAEQLLDPPDIVFMQQRLTDRTAGEICALSQAGASRADA